MSDTIDIGQLSVKEVDNLERRLRAMLYVVWQVRGVRYQIVPAPPKNERQPPARPALTEAEQVC